MTVYETSITNPKKQLEFYKDLSEQLQQESRQLKEDNFKLQARTDKYKCRIDKAIEHINSQMHYYDDDDGDCGVDCCCDGFELLKILGDNNEC